MLVVTLPERSGRNVGRVEHAVSARTAAPGGRRASRVTAVTLAALALLLLPGSLVLDALTGQNLAENGAPGRHRLRVRRDGGPGHRLAPAG